MSRTDPIVGDMLEGLLQHRLLSTAQLHDLYTPTRSIQWTRRIVSHAERTGLMGTVRRAGGQKVAYLTPRGIDAMAAVPVTEQRRKLISPEHAAGPLQHHTLAVNDVGIAFVHAARARGDQFGPLAWRHEIAHPIGPRPGRRRPEQLIADALLTYEQHEPDGSIRIDYRFLELDRATMPASALAAKLARYARLHHHTITTRQTAPVRFWETIYPVFPTVLLVLDRGRPAALSQRLETVLSLCAEDPALRRTPEIEISACLLEELQACGPFSPIWRALADPGAAVDWLGQPADPDERTTQ